MKTFSSGIKLFSVFGVLAALIALFAYMDFADADCNSWIPPEIKMDEQVNWDTDLRSHVNVSFDTDKNGKNDFIASFRPSPKEYGITSPAISPAEMKKKYPDNQVFSYKVEMGKQTTGNYLPKGDLHIPAVGVFDDSSFKGGQRHTYFVTNKNPFYYILDRNEDGAYDLIYKDFEEDGINGNETVDYCPDKEEQKKYMISNEEWAKQKDMAIADYTPPDDPKAGRGKINPSKF